MNNSFSQPVNEVLSKYPQWLSLVESHHTLTSFPLGYCPFAIDIFDQHGLLCGQRGGDLVFETQRDINQPSEFIAWVLDDQLALFYVGDEIIVNRLNLMASSFAALQASRGEK